MIVNESNFETLERASKMTSTDYEIKWFDAENIDGYIDTENLMSIIEDLICEVDRLQEEIEDMEQNIQDNYKPIPVAEQVGISDKDFI